MIEHTLCPICQSSMKIVKSQFGPYWKCSKLGCEGTRDSQGRSRREKDEDYENDESDEPSWKRRYE